MKKKSVAAFFTEFTEKEDHPLKLGAHICTSEHSMNQHLLEFQNVCGPEPLTVVSLLEAWNYARDKLKFQANSLRNRSGPFGMVTKLS